MVLCVLLYRIFCWDMYWYSSGKLLDEYFNYIPKFFTRMIPTPLFIICSFVYLLFTMKNFKLSFKFLFFSFTRISSSTHC